MFDAAKLRRGVIQKGLEIRPRLVLQPVKRLLVTGSQAFVEMTQYQQHCCQALLAVHHIIRVVIICPQDKWLKAVELFSLEVLALCELMNVVQ